MYRQLQGAYALRPFAAAWRTAALLMIVGVNATLFLSLLLFLGSH